MVGLPEGIVAAPIFRDGMKDCCVYGTHWMLFCLWTALASFQRLMNMCLGDLEGCSLYFLWHGYPLSGYLDFMDKLFDHLVYVLLLLIWPSASLGRPLLDILVVWWVKPECVQ